MNVPSSPQVSLQTSQLMGKPAPEAMLMTNIQHQSRCQYPDSRQQQEGSNPNPHVIALVPPIVLQCFFWCHMHQ